MLTNNSKYYNVQGINQLDNQKICNYIQGSVYSWSKNKPNEWFTTSSLFGKENFDWQGTPMQVLYDKHINQGKSHKEAIKFAGRDAGHLLKKVLQKDKRIFDVDKSWKNRYKWIP
uniref:hypothetical protein n=1 Tax=Gelidibacter sp. TaxID=2018083 RepID=UPI004049B690